MNPNDDGRRLSDLGALEELARRLFGATDKLVVSSVVTEERGEAGGAFLTLEVYASFDGSSNAPPSRRVHRRSVRIPFDPDALHYDGRHNFSGRDTATAAAIRALTGELTQELAAQPVAAAPRIPRGEVPDDDPVGRPVPSKVIAITPRVPPDPKQQMPRRPIDRLGKSFR